MTRIVDGVLLIVLAILVMAWLPILLNGWSVLAWWFAAALLVLGVWNIGRTFVERWDDHDDR